MNLQKLGILCGVAAPIIWVSLIAVAGASRPEFSHVTDYISELGERGSSTEFLMRYVAFGFTGFLNIGFAAALLAIFRGRWLSMLAAVLLALDGLGRIGAGVFGCDPGCTGMSPNQELHRLFATIGFSSGILAAMAWGISLRRHGWPTSLAWYSLVSGALAMMLLLLMLWEHNPWPTPGLFEHLATGVLSLWMLVFASCLLRRPRAPGR
jgi:hypothetical membrane protein